MYEDLLGAIRRHNELLQDQNSFHTLISNQLGALMSAVSDLRDKIAEVATNVRDKIAALEAANAAAQQAAADAMAAAGASEAAKAALQVEFDAVNAEVASLTGEVDKIDEFAPPVEPPVEG